jgi:acylphosphatase
MPLASAVANVRGVVQGVGFRWWCVRKAREYRLKGYAANLIDGSVEVAMEGERGMIEEFIKALKVGPIYATVTDVNIKWLETLKGYKDFGIENKD